MIVYSMILFAAAVLFLALGTAVYKGNTNLIHDYHQTNIKESDRQAYGRAFAKGLFALCGTLFVSGITALFVQEGAAAVSMIVLLAGLTVSIVLIVSVQKKYNGEIF